MKRLLTFLPLLVLAALAVLFAGYALHHDPHVNPAALVGQTAPALRLPPLKGGPAVPIRADGQGPVLINFFASWCAPCVEEAPALMALKAQGVKVIGIAYKDDPQKSLAFLQDYGDPYSDVFMDRNGLVGVDYGVSGVPETFLVASDGRVLSKKTGPLTPDAAEALADQLEKAR